jgi:hypothetical protein
MMVRMADADTRAAARELARVRWDPSPVVARAVETVVSRSAELDASQRAALEAAITAPGGEP